MSKPVELELVCDSGNEPQFKTMAAPGHCVRKIHIWAGMIIDSMVIFSGTLDNEVMVQHPALGTAFSSDVKPNDVFELKKDDFITKITI